MNALHPKGLLDTAAAAGIQVSLTAENGLLVTPASSLTAELRNLIKSHKAVLVDYLQRQAANDPSEAERELIEERAAIMEFDSSLTRAQAERLALLHTQYLLHHWGCKTCCAAGQGRGTRCTVGNAHWIAYDSEARLHEGANK